MSISELGIAAVRELTPKKHGDHRGFFSEVYNKHLLAEAGIHIDFVQDNHSLSAEKGTVRGLHFQTPPFAQDKLVRVTRGAVFDVAVDLRRGSPSYGRHASAVLSAEAWNQLFVPIGFAHGFMTLKPDTEVIYKVSHYYAPDHDEGLLWNDPDSGHRLAARPRHGRPVGEGPQPAETEGSRESVRLRNGEFATVLTFGPCGGGEMDAAAVFFLARKGGETAAANPANAGTSRRGTYLRANGVNDSRRGDDAGRDRRRHADGIFPRPCRREKTAVSRKVREFRPAVPARPRRGLAPGAGTVPADPPRASVRDGVRGADTVAVVRHDPKHGWLSWMFYPARNVNERRAGYLPEKRVSAAGNEPEPASVRVRGLSRNGPCEVARAAVRRPRFSAPPTAHRGINSMVKYDRQRCVSASPIPFLHRSLTDLSLSGFQGALSDPAGRSKDSATLSARWPAISRMAGSRSRPERSRRSSSLRRAPSSYLTMLRSPLSPGTRKCAVFGPRRGRPHTACS